MPAKVHVRLGSNKADLFGSLIQVERCFAIKRVKFLSLRREALSSRKSRYDIKADVVTRASVPPSRISKPEYNFQFSLSRTLALGGVPIFILRLANDLRLIRSDAFFAFFSRDLRLFLFNNS